MAVILEGGCRVTHMHDGKPLVEGTLRIWKQIGRATGAQAISLRVMDFAPGNSPAIRNDDCDEILYVLENDRAAVGDSSQGQARSAPPLDQVLANDARPEGVRENGPSSEILINGRGFVIDTDTGIYIR